MGHFWERGTAARFASPFSVPPRHFAQRTSMNARAYISLALGCALISAPLACRKSDPPEFVKRGTEYLQSGKYAEASVELRRALQIDPRLGEARLKLGDAYANSNQPANALREYVRAADLLPDRAE